MRDLSRRSFLGVLAGTIAVPLVIGRPVQALILPPAPKLELIPPFAEGEYFAEVVEVRSAADRLELTYRILDTAARHINPNPTSEEFEREMVRQTEERNKHFLYLSRS